MLTIEKKLLSTRRATYGHGETDCDVRRRSRPILRIVFGHEDRRLLPITAMRDRLDDPAERQIVVRHGGTRGWKARARALCVVVVQQNEHQVRKLAVLFKLGELLQEDIRSVLIRNAAFGRGIPWMVDVTKADDDRTRSDVDLGGAEFPVA